MPHINNLHRRLFSFGNRDTGDDILHEILSTQFNPLAIPATTSDTAFPFATIPSYHSVDLTTSTSTTIRAVPTTPSTTQTTSSTSTTKPVLPATTKSAQVTAIPSVTPTPSAASDTTSSHKSGSSAAVGVTVTLVIVALCAAAFYFVRRKHIQDRLKRRSTWNPPGMDDQRLPPVPEKEKFDMDMEDGGSPYGGAEFDTIDINEKEKQSATPLPANITYNTLPKLQLHIPANSLPTPPPALHAASYAPPRMPSPPPVTTTSANPLPPLVANTHFAAVSVPRASVASSAFSTGSAMGAQVMTGTLVVVARTFVPSLPDELSIQTGEQVRVLTRFDDGWAHVERTKSGAGAENGVVPVECLEAVPMRVSVPASGLSQEAVESWRLSKRKSSLVAPGPTQY